MSVCAFVWRVWTKNFWLLWRYLETHKYENAGETRARTELHDCECQLECQCDWECEYECGYKHHGWADSEHLGADYSSSCHAHTREQKKQLEPCYSIWILLSRTHEAQPRPRARDSNNNKHIRSSTQYLMVFVPYNSRVRPMSQSQSQSQSAQCEPFLLVP